MAKGRLLNHVFGGSLRSPRNGPKTEVKSNVFDKIEVKLNRFDTGGIVKAEKPAAKPARVEKPVAKIAAKRARAEKPVEKRTRVEKPARAEKLVAKHAAKRTRVAKPAAKMARAEKPLEKPAAKIARAEKTTAGESQKSLRMVNRKIESDGTELMLETDIDKLLAVIQKEKSIKASELARIFNVPRSKVEEWGIILEEHRLVEVHYPTFGEPVFLAVKKPARRPSDKMPVKEDEKEE